MIITADAIRLNDKGEITRAIDLILTTNPKLTPALSIRWMDQWIRSNVQIVYRITSKSITGRTTVAQLIHKQLEL